jgi:hypothetical protein
MKERSDISGGRAPVGEPGVICVRGDDAVSGTFELFVFEFAVRGDGSIKGERKLFIISVFVCGDGLIGSSSESESSTEFINNFFVFCTVGELGLRFSSARLSVANLNASIFVFFSVTFFLAEGEVGDDGETITFPVPLYCFTLISFGPFFVGDGLARPVLGLTTGTYVCNSVSSFPASSANTTLRLGL